MAKRFTAEDLRRFALAKRRISKENESRREEARLSVDQIDRLVRKEVESGNVNEHGYIVKIGGD